MTEKTKTVNPVKILDWVIALISLAVGLVLVVLEWPQPSLWSWLLLAVGVLGVPLAHYNPLGKFQKWFLRLLVKRR